jgi:hypothetical protein
MTCAVVFILDCTGSMGSYIASATANIELIVENILHSGKLSTAESLQIGLIAYRDYPPQDNSYITKVSARLCRITQQASRFQRTDGLWSCTPVVRIYF